MLNDILLGRAHQRLDHVDLHRHAQLACKPSVFSRVKKVFVGLFAIDPLK